ncbi:hypothetical protein ACIBI7_18975, partial [Nonomuraea fuscirosea]
PGFPLSAYQDPPGHLPGITWPLTWTSGWPHTPEKFDQAANRRKRGSRGGRPVSHDPDLYKQRTTVERCINRIQEWRGPAFRFDKTPDSYLAGLHLRGVILWIGFEAFNRSEDLKSVPA